jgi:hypothetical protein
VAFLFHTPTIVATMRLDQETQAATSTSHIRHPCIAGVFQAFRSGDDIVRIQAVLHPLAGTFVVLWSDIKACFPGLTRVQNKDVYVPLVRCANARLYACLLALLASFVCALCWCAREG